MGNPLIGPDHAPLTSHNDAEFVGEAANSPVSDSIAVVAFLSQEVAGSMGRDWLSKVPLDLTERYCLTTVLHNHPTGQMLHDASINFMKAYSNPETHAEALKAIDYLAHLSEKSD